MRPEEIIPQGNGSGLDADTLDGLHASAFVLRGSGFGSITLATLMFCAVLCLGGVIMAIDISGSARRQAWFPIHNAAIVTPNDSANLAYVTTAIRIASSGALRVTLLGGTTVTYPTGSLAVGIAHPMRVTRVHATGTTVGAGNIVAEW